MTRGLAFLVGVGAGAALAWALDRRAGATKLERAGAAVARLAGWPRGLPGGMDDADVAAPATPMSGSAGAAAMRDTTPASDPPPDELAVRPTPVTTGPLPLTDESAGGHQILGGGTPAPPSGGDHERAAPAAGDRDRP